MVLSFDTTAASMRSSRWIELGQSRFANTASRLSTGLRIDTAASDAAGSLIASKLKAQTLGWHQGQRNIQDGVSLAQVADTTFATLNDLIGRIRELAVQSANGTYSDVERSMLQTEVDQLRSEIGRVVQRTSFNGVSLMQGTFYQPPPNVDVDGAVNGSLNGVTTFDGVTLSAGGLNPYLAGAVEGAGSSAGSVNTRSGTYEVRVLTAPTQAEVVGGVMALTTPNGLTPVFRVTMTGPGGTVTQDINPNVGPAAYAAILDGAAAGIGVDVTAEPYYGGGINFLVFRSSTGGAARSVTVSAVSLDPLYAPEDYLGIGPGVLTANGTDMTATINGLAASVTSSAGSVILRLDSPGDDADGLALSINNAPLNAIYTTGPFPASAGWVNVEGLPSQILDLQLGIQGGPNAEHQQALVIKPMTTGAMGMTGTNDIGAIDVSTQSGALAALDLTDDALEQIAGARSQLGAAWNSLEQALGIAGVGEDGHEAARSRIEDADVAVESTELIKAQIQTEAASATAAQIHADAARTLQLISGAEVELQIVSPESSSASPAPSASGGGSGGIAASPAASSSGGFTPSATAAGSGSPIGPTSVFAATSTFASSNEFGGYSPLPVTPGLNAQSVTPGYNPVPVTPGFTPLPVLGTRSPAETAAAISGLSSGQMFSMIAGSVA